MRTLKAVLLAKEAAEVKEIIRQRINQLSLSDVRRILAADTEASSHASHSIIMSLCLDQPTPDEKRYEKSDPIHRFVSCPAVWEALNNRHGELLYSEIKLTTELSQRVLETSLIAGYLWEAYCHARMSAGGVFTLIPMAIRGTNLVPCHTMPKPITIGHLTRTKFRPGDPAVSTQEDTKYYIPSASNNAMFNAFLFSKSNQIALQTTISSSHLSVVRLSGGLLNACHKATNNSSILSFPIAPPGPSSANWPPTLPGQGLSSSCFCWIMVMVSITHPQRTCGK